jgi:hypothetical protein
LFREIKKIITGEADCSEEKMWIIKYFVTHEGRIYLVGSIVIEM